MKTVHFGLAILLLDVLVPEKDAAARYRKMAASTCAAEYLAECYGSPPCPVNNNVSWGVVANLDPYRARVFDCAVLADPSLDMGAVTQISTDIVNGSNFYAVGAAACVLYANGSGGACGAYSYATPTLGPQRLWLSSWAWNAYLGQYAYISYSLPPAMAEWGPYSEIIGSVIYTP